MASKKSNWIDALIGKRIRDRREERGLSQESLGRLLAASAQQIQKYESGANRIAASNLFRLAHELRVPVTHFYELVEEALPSPSSFSEDGDPTDLCSPSDDKITEIVRWLLREDDAQLDHAITVLNSGTVPRRFFFEPRSAHTRFQCGIGILWSDAASGPEHQEMIEQIRGFCDQAILVLPNGSQRGLHTLLAQLLGDFQCALRKQFCSVRTGRVGVLARLHDGEKMIDRMRLGHEGYLSLSRASVTSRVTLN